MVLLREGDEQVTVLAPSPEAEATLPFDVNNKSSYHSFTHSFNRSAWSGQFVGDCEIAFPEAELNEILKGLNKRLVWSCRYFPLFPISIPLTLALAGPGLSGTGLFFLLVGVEAAWCCFFWPMIAGLGMRQFKSYILQLNEQYRGRLAFAWIVRLTGQAQHPSVTCEHVEGYKPPIRTQELAVYVCPHPPANASSPLENFVTDFGKEGGKPNSVLSFTDTTTAEDDDDDAERSIVEIV